MFLTFAVAAIRRPTIETGSGTLMRPDSSAASSVNKHDTVLVIAENG